jgi:tetratricopeptide (TPR) repeat protein
MSKMKKLLLFSVFLGLSLFSLNESSWAMEDDDSPYTVGQKGMALYEEGDYQSAAPLLRNALDADEITFALTYADICHRNLDKGKHPPKEAALWYVRAADAGDGDALAYLQSLSPTFLEETPEDQKIQALIHEWTRQDADAGYTFYTTGKFVEASKPLKRASRGNHNLAQELYGDICLRQLDGKPHSYLEAAMWYLLSAHGGDSQSLSYLKSLIPNILEGDNHEAQMKGIVGCWVMQETLPDLKPIKPDHVNGYLISKYHRRIGKTAAQKLPYLFERIASAIMFNLTGRVHSVIDDQLVPQADGFEFSPEVRSCVAQAGMNSKFIKPHLSACVYGPVYMKYFQSLDTKLEGNFLKTPTSAPTISPIYEFLLDALQEATKHKKAKNFSNLSHHDYPWLWAGIMFWKEKNQEAFNYTSLSEAELLKRLTEMSEPISEEDLSTILHHIEPKSVWPNDGAHPICVEFDQRMRGYFTTSLSRQEEVVKTTEAHFYTRLREHELDYSNPKDREILKTPFLMFYCQKLTLRNIPNTKPFYQALQEAQRYFTDQELNIVFSGSFKPKSEWVKNILKLLDKMEKRGIQVTIIKD